MSLSSRNRLHSRDIVLILLVSVTYVCCSETRQNFHGDSEAGINRQINMQLYASYTYQSMAFFYNRDDVALPGLAKFFRKASQVERENAEKFMEYQNQRGGSIVFQDIRKPNSSNWGTALEAMQASLELKKRVNSALLDLHEKCSNHKDVQMADFLETEFLEKQVNDIKEIGDQISKLRRVGGGLGEYIYDKDLMGYSTQCGKQTVG